MKASYNSSRRFAATLACLAALTSFNAAAFNGFAKPEAECFVGEANAKDAPVSNLSQAQLNCVADKKLAALDGRGSRATVSLIILFRNGSDSVEKDYFEQLSKLGNMMNRPNMARTRMTIDGHANATGSAVLNKGLTKRRANRVMQIMVENFGVEPSRLESRGFGFDKPRAGLDPKDDSNRRVEFDFLSVRPSP